MITSLLHKHVCWTSTTHCLFMLSTFLGEQADHSSEANSPRQAKLTLDEFQPQGRESCYHCPDGSDVSYF